MHKHDHSLCMEKYTREPAVAGSFYPAEAAELVRQLDTYLKVSASKDPPPKAMIAPHAGYIYSGPIAASVYVRLRNIKQKIERVILLGPAHRVAFYGLAVPANRFFKTPLGKVSVDLELVSELDSNFSQVVIDDRPHAEEHSLEVHLPFLQRVLGDFKLLPLVVGRATVTDVADVIRACWGGPETLIVISSDLSHFHDYVTAVELDSTTSRAILDMRGDAIGPEEACGYLPVRGLLSIAKEKGLNPEMVEQKNSGDTAGSRDRVVGYGAYAFN